LSPNYAPCRCGDFGGVFIYNLLLFLPSPSFGFQDWLIPIGRMTTWAYNRCFCSWDPLMPTPLARKNCKFFSGPSHLFLHLIYLLVCLCYHCLHHLVNYYIIIYSTINYFCQYPFRAILTKPLSGGLGLCTRTHLVTFEEGVYLSSHPLDQFIVVSQAG
jgi:hypothetical protein